MDSTAALILGLSLIIIMFGMGLSLVIDDFKKVLLYPKAIFIGLVNQLVLLPLIGFALISMFSVPIEIAIGVIILAACPGGPTSNLITHLAKGDTALSVSLTAVSSLITVFTIPLVVNFGINHFTAQTGEEFHLDVIKTITQIFIIVVIPVFAGMAIRSKKEKFALKMARPVRIASAIVLALVIAGIFIKERENVIPYFRQAGIIVLLLNLSTMILGYFSALIFKLNRKQSLSISIESGIQNGTLAITIATVLLSNATFAIAPAVYSLIMFFTGGIIIFIGLRGKSSN